ncbi:hypothetical protein [Lentzea sp. NPDC060358]|uniref:hypothetical protein n=1 Tax=Lentzea sp. NPDC060358 TaxID=3347103 RepID=UPI0036479311
MAQSFPSWPPARLLLVLPGPTLVRKAVRAGVDVRVVLDGTQRAEDFPLPADRVVRVDGSRGAGIAAVIRGLIDEHHVSHVLDGGGSPLRERLPTAGPDDDPFERELVPSRRCAEEPRSTDEVREVVATTLTVDGMHRVVGITERVEDAGARSYVFPASLPELRTVRVRAAVTSMLDLAGHEFGPAQMRVALTDPQPRVLRSRPRFDVDGIADLIEAATGFDLPTELFRALAGAPLQPPTPRWFAGARFARVPGSRTGGGDCGASFAEGVSPEVVRARLDAAGASSD